MKILIFFLLFIGVSLQTYAYAEQPLPVYYWSPKQEEIENFGDYLSHPLVTQLSYGAIKTVTDNRFSPKVLTIGSIIHFAKDGDVIWGSGINGKHLDAEDYHFSNLDMRAVRGPLTRLFLKWNFGIQCPKIYGDPCLLLPHFFPHFKKKLRPTKSYTLIPHISEISLFPKTSFPQVVYPTENWKIILDHILDSNLVIASSLHGIVLAEAFGVPARLLRRTDNEPLFKYQDYYYGTGRLNFSYATSIEEALEMGGEPPFQCDLEKLYNAFPFDLWPDILIKSLPFKDKKQFKL